MRHIIWTFWAVYLAVLAAMLLLADAAWFEPLANYSQTIVWLTHEAASARIGGLLGENRLGDALAFARINDLSLLMILFAMAAGAVHALSATSPLPQRPRETHYVLGLLAVMIALNPQVTAWLAQLSQTIPQPAYTATPAYWLATMVLSAVLITRYAAFGAHDLVLAVRVRLQGAQAAGITAAE